MSLVTQSNHLENYFKLHNIKFRLIESDLSNLVYLADKVPQVDYVSSASKYGNQYKITLKETVGTGGIAGGAGHWSIVPDHPGLGGKFKNLRKKKQNKKGTYSFLVNKKDANKSHIVGVMNNNGLAESKKISRVILEQFVEKNSFYNGIKKLIDSYWNSHDSLKLVNDLCESISLSNELDDIRIFSQHVSDILTGFGVQSVNNYELDEQDVEFLHRYVSERTV